MSIPLIRQALEVYLEATAGSIPTIYENTGEDPPATAHQRAAFMPNDPDDAESGPQTTARGLFQVSCMYPLGNGPGDADARAEVLRKRFRQGTSLPNGAVTVQITSTPRVATGFADGSYWHVPVTIRWQARVDK